MTDTHQTNPARAYQEFFGPAIFEPLSEVLLAAASPASGERVLDVACGTGIATRAAAVAVGAGGRVVGIDINPAMVEVARSLPVPEGGAAIDFRPGDALALDVDDGAFDLVLCQQGLQFFPDRGKGLAEMRRALTASGRLTLAVWQGVDRHPIYRAMAEAEAPHLAKVGAALTVDDLTAPFSLGDPAELRALLEGAGFSDVELVERSIRARFADADNFVERMEFAYAAVIPQFADDPAAFAEYLEAIGRDTKEIVAEYRDGDSVVVPMHAHIVVARP